MNNQIKRAVNGLLFIGGRSDSCDKSGDETGCESEVARVARRLREHGRELASLLALDIFYDPNETTEDTLKCELAAVLPVDARPCLTIIPVMPDSLDKTNGIAMQAISAADPVREQAATDQRFPMSAYAGPIVALGGMSSCESSDKVVQGETVMKEIEELLVANGTDIDDVVRLNVFYTGVGSRGDWSEEAGSRASHFTEPGPVATGVPVLLLPKKDAQVLVRVIAVKGARENMQREYGWPDKHWDWPYHMPYKHGCNCAGTVFVGGQVALTPDAEVMDPGDLEAQTRTSIDYILSVLNEFALDEDGLLRLTAFFQYQNHESPGIVARAVKDALGGREVPLLLVALPELSYENMVVEIEAEAR